MGLKSRKKWGRKFRDTVKKYLQNAVHVFSVTQGSQFPYLFHYLFQRTIPLTLPSYLLFVKGYYCLFKKFTYQLNIIKLVFEF